MRFHKNIYENAALAIVAKSPKTAKIKSLSLATIERDDIQK